ncbi:hypothetical protein [Aquimarina sp. RZ0]|uniref:hypothetical protein n=1 Tax=Aquimarina sp. RZ0 TaxID=2607730 RepID=UPI0011F26C9F|nr:hypothetical protein [Aquimarina sp. RZ0]KAA1244311.1 hypothetical protein F0000_16910 [Aquimarina sp. RZ0]
MKILKFSMLILIATSIVHCTNDVENDALQENSINQDEVSPEVLTKLESMGFDVRQIPVKAKKGGYIVGGDIFITDEAVQQYTGDKQAFFSIVDCDRARSIRIQNDLGNNAAGRGFRRGLNLWNTVNGTTLELIPVTNNPDIVVRLSEPGEIGGWGLGEFPTNGVEGGLIILNLNEPSLDGDPVTSREWSNILAHEIGHNIGFLHAEQGIFGTQIPGTPINDTRSIMTSGSNPSVVFNARRVSNGDRRALRLMYNDNNGFCQ